ncbi:hypothetical protein NPS53_09790 [Pseudomonas putida]|uniref:hypothetical protein n=1 Tax=Pseudomonas putida TaxID=303 RepID=UPI0023637C37|nr:hypothetical protein [Pseudomonas putida]MDD2139870.1 hypothetical protein [Pseudomonas putida]HDS1721793.1 hypothetical protein [Pseudomonas putida]
MKDTVQIKADLVTGQHDALIDFYGRFNRLFVNKLLLKLCEGVIKDYEPSLALFQSNVPDDAVVSRKVAIRIEKEKHPLMWDFYKDLPYGSRTMVIINLMNHYATLAEADPTIMENTYWSRRPDPTLVVAQEPAAQLIERPNAERQASESAAPAAHAVVAAEVAGAGGVSISVQAAAEPEKLEDPLEGHTTGL